MLRVTGTPFSLLFRGVGVSVLAIAASPACRCDEPKGVSGDGTLRLLRIADDRGVNTMAVTRDDGFLALATTGPHGALLVTDRKLSQVGQKPRPPTRLTASREVDRDVLCFSGRTFTVFSLPNLRQVDTLPVDYAKMADVLGWGEPRLCARRGGWVSVNTRGEVVRIETEPLRLGQAGRATTRDVKGAAVDQETGKLVICGDGTYAEVFDLECMKSVGVTELACSEVEFGVCAVSGRAWIPTTDGALMQLDIDSVKPSGKIVLARAEDARAQVSTRVGVGSAGRYMAASASHMVDDRGRGTGAWVTTLKVFRIGEKRIEEIACIHATLTQAINSIAVVEKEELVVLGTPASVLSWYWKK